MSNRGILVRAVAGVAAAAAVAAAIVVSAGSPAGAGATATLEVVKEVVGDAPAGSFLIEVTCDTEGVIPLTFNGPGSQSVALTPDTQDCVVEETESLGAQSIAYFCEDVVAPADPGDAGCQPVGAGGNFGQAQDADQVMRITVTNTFAGSASSPPAPEATSPPAPATAAPAPAAPPPAEEVAPAGGAAPASSPTPAPAAPVAGSPAVTG